MASDEAWRQAARKRFLEIRAIVREAMFPESTKKDSDGVRWYRLISYGSKRPTTNTFEVFEADAEAEQRRIDARMTVTDAFLDKVFERLWEYPPEDQEGGLQREHLRTALNYALAVQNAEAQ